MSSRIIQQTQPIIGKVPVADGFAGTVRTDVINMRDAQHATFTQFTGAGATGTSTVAVFASDDVDITTSAAVTFRRREYPSTGVPGDLVSTASTGFTTTAGINRITDIEVDAADLGETGQYVFVRFTESVNSPVLGGVLCRLSGIRWQGDSARTQIT